MGLRDLLRGRHQQAEPPERPEPDYPPRLRHREDDGDIVELIHEAAATATAPDRPYWRAWDLEYLKTPAGERFLSLPAERLARAVVVAWREFHRTPVTWQPANNDTPRMRVHFAADQFARRALRRRLPLDEAALQEAFEFALTDHQGQRWGHLNSHSPVGLLVSAAEQNCTAPVGGALAATLRTILGLIDRYPGAETRRWAARIDVLLGTPVVAGLGGGDPWTRALGAALELMDDTDRATGEALLALAASHGRSARPSKAFLARREELVARAGRAEAGAAAAALLAAAAGVAANAENGQAPPDTGDLLRGLAVATAATSGAAAAAALADLAVAGWRKIPSLGPQCRKAASTAVAALGEHPDGAAHIGRVKVLVKQPAARAEVDAAIAAAARRMGIPEAEFEERVVPDFGLAGGAREEQLGAHVARTAFDERLRARLTFVNGAGKALKSVPAEVKRDHAARLAELKREVKDVQAMLDAQRLRLERLLMDDPAWPAADWRQRYAGHGLVGPLARTLIWELTDAAGTTSTAAWRDGAWRDAGGAAADAGAAATVRLWHPAAAPADAVRAWRAALEQWQVTQPFKQAHREVYLLTDAERTTGSYSNRFAAHVLRQHQMAALARARGWSYALQGAWDSDDEVARLALPQHGLTAEFYVERPWDSEGWNDSGVFTHILTDQVRFKDDRGSSVTVDAVAPRVFSEVLRDVDLFVGVASIGNDPGWMDRGAGRRYDTYWNAYSFGELSAAAEVRKDVLERLLPKLAIAASAAIEGRFLVVRGSLRTYRIHLGSGNIRMEPNDQYLCIVPGGRDRSTDAVLLPFEGDQVLSIILSKAIMLAADEKIADATITSQIRR